MNKKFHIILAVGLMMGLFLVAGSATASLLVGGARLNGLNDLNAGGGDKIAATISVDITNGSVWKSTAYRFGEGEWVCVDTPNHTGDGLASETFLITAPSQEGTSNANFKVYSNNDCTDGLGVVSATASLMTASINILSLKTNEIMLIVASMLLIVLMIGLFYIGKNASKEI